MPKTTIRLDRVQLVSWAPPGRKPPNIEGFVVTRDSFVRSQTTTSTYARCRHFKSLTNDTRLYWQYSRQKGWLKPWKITVVADDLRGLRREEIDRVLKHCRWYRLLLVEVAIDFHPSTGVDRQFIRRHAVFGKSRRPAKKRENVLCYGTRKSAKFVRCYDKVDLGVYRVELELHSSLLRHHDISTVDDLVHLPEVVCPKHLGLVDCDWNQLSRHMAKKMGDRSISLMAAARRRANSISRLQRYLRRKGVFNAHRLLVPHAINENVSRALKRWARGF